MKQKRLSLESMEMNEAARAKWRLKQKTRPARLPFARCRVDAYLLSLARTLERPRESDAKKRLTHELEPSVSRPQLALAGPDELKTISGLDEAQASLWIANWRSLARACKSTRRRPKLRIACSLRCKYEPRMKVNNKRKILGVV